MATIFILATCYICAAGYLWQHSASLFAVISKECGESFNILPSHEWSRLSQFFQFKEKNKHYKCSLWFYSRKEGMWRFCLVLIITFFSRLQHLSLSELFSNQKLTFKVDSFGIIRYYFFTFTLPFCFVASSNKLSKSHYTSLFMSSTSWKTSWPCIEGIGLFFLTFQECGSHNVLEVRTASIENSLSGLGYPVWRYF